MQLLSELPGSVEEVRTALANRIIKGVDCIIDVEEGHQRYAVNAYIDYSFQQRLLGHVESRNKNELLEMVEEISKKTAPVGEYGGKVLYDIWQEVIGLLLVGCKPSLGVRETNQMKRQSEQELSGNDIYELYDRFQIAVDIRKKSGHAFGVLLRAQAIMSENESRVELYEESIAALAQQSGSACRQELTYDLAVKIHMAHELFHFIEYRRKQTVSQKLDPVLTFKLLRFKRKAHIQSCSEIAAHAFAKHLLNLSVLPNYYDYQYLIYIKKLSRQK